MNKNDADEEQKYLQQKVSWEVLVRETTPFFSWGLERSTSLFHVNLPFYIFATSPVGQNKFMLL